MRELERSICDLLEEIMIRSDNLRIKFAPELGVRDSDSGLKLSQELWGIRLLAEEIKEKYQKRE